MNKENTEIDTVWSRLQEEGRELAEQEPVMASMIERVLLEKHSLESSLAELLACKLNDKDLCNVSLREIIEEAFLADEHAGLAIRRDLEAFVDRDPATDELLEPLLYFKGFHAISTARAGHWLWKNGRVHLARFLQSRMSEAFGVDIHPAARIGSGILLDHATSFVVGETAIIENDVSILHEVTLGGTGKEHGARHPIIRSGVLLGAGAKVLGRVEIGEGAKIGAGSVVLSDIPVHKTAAGVPAKIVCEASEANPALFMNHRLE